MSFRSVSLALLLPVTAVAADLPVTTLVQLTSSPPAAVTFEVHETGACSAPVHVQTVSLTDPSVVVERVEALRGQQPLTAYRIHATLTDVPTLAGTWVRTEGTHLRPLGPACQPQGAPSDLLARLATLEDQVAAHDLDLADLMLAIDDNTAAIQDADEAGRQALCTLASSVGQCAAMPSCDETTACFRKTAFVTSATYTGNLVDDAATAFPGCSGAADGQAAADCICQSHATAAGLSGAYLAWVSLFANPSHAPVVRFSSSPGPYAMVDGTVIAPDFAGLVDNTLDAALDVDEHGDTQTGWAWTATGGTGGVNAPVYANTCDDWATSGAIQGRAGTVGQSSVSWTSSSLQWCGTQAHLYCFQQ